MNRAKSKKNKGFTLIELIVGIALISVVIGISGSMITLAMRSHDIVVEEYDTQSAIRIASEQVNNIVRYSKAVFAVPEAFVADVSKMDPGWNYLGVSEDKRRIVIYEYDSVSDTHIENVQVTEQENVEYELLFEQDAALGDGLINYKIVAYVLSENEDGDMVRTIDKVVFESQVESVNALQIIDKGTASSPSIALAYRSDGQTQGDGRNQFAAVSIVLDSSGSMSTEVNDKARIQWLKEALGYTKNGTSYSGILDEFAQEDNIEVSLVPFSTTANYPNRTDANSSDGHPYYTAKDDLATLKTRVNGLSASGGTNTGDALRRAYFGHVNFDYEEADYPEQAEQYDYMIILVDGQTTYESWTREWVDNGEYVWNNRRDRWEWDKDWEYTWTSTYLEEGHFQFNQDEPTGSQYTTSTDSLRGNGSTTMTTDTYVKAVGNLIKERGITTYVIGFAPNINTGVTTLAEAVGAKEVFLYSDDFDLNEVFANIANDIMADFWIITGPQVQ